MHFRSYTCLTEHILILRILYLCYITYSCISDLILVLRSIYMYFGSYTCVIEHILILRILYWNTELILILHNLYFFYRYRSTRRYYRDFTCTEVPVGTTKQIQRYP